MRKINQVLIGFLFVTAFAVGLVSGQQMASNSGQVLPSNQTYILSITNDEGRETKLSLADIGKLTRQTLKTKDHDKDVTFEGYPLIDVLKLAGVEFGDTLRGKRLASFLLVEAADNYQVVIALPEIDPAFNDKMILLADKRDGQPLSGNEGTLRLVVPGEKKAGRWVRQVVGMKILKATK